MQGLHMDIMQFPKDNIDWFMKTAGSDESTVTIPPPSPLLPPYVAIIHNLSNKPSHHI